MMLERRLLLTTYQFGAGAQYSTLSSLPALAPGDTVDINPGVYNQAFNFTASGTAAQPITIQGVGATRPIFDGTGLSVDGGGSTPRALFQIQGNYYVIQNLEFRNASNYENNGAGIRVTGADYTTINNVVVDNNQMGLMSDSNDNLLIEHSTFDHNGDLAYDGYTHNLYLGGNRATVEYCDIVDAYTGQNVKSRAHYTALLYNYIADSNEGEVGLVDSSDTATPDSNALMVGNVIVSKPDRTGNTGKFIDFGQDEGGPHDGTLYLVNNTLIAGSPSINFLQSLSTDTSIVATNNIFYGSDSLFNGPDPDHVSGSNNWLPNTATLLPGFVNSIQGTDPGLVNLTNGDYNLTAASPELNAGLENPTAVDGTGTTISATPYYEYVNDTTNTPRPVDGQLDVGAYELSTGLTITNAYPVLTGTATSVAAFTVSLYPAQASPVTVNYSTTAGTATAGVDFQATSGSLTFAPGQTIATISVPVYGDPLGSSTKTFTVTLGSVSGAALAIPTATGTITEKNPTGTATYLGTDSKTQGNWKGTYGADGYNVIGDTVSYPSYATVTASNQATWSTPTTSTNVEALQSAVAGSTNRVEACWYGDQFTVDVNLIDGLSHQVSLYLGDLGAAGRTEKIDVIDVGTGNVLDTETVTSFSNGTYLSWTLNGHVQFVITNVEDANSFLGPNAVLSGIFFGDGGTAATSPVKFVGTDVTTQGSWKGIYGTDGYNVIGDASSYPSYATVNPSGQSSWTWAASTSDVRALQDASVGSADRLASCWYGSGFSVDINLTDGQLHEVSIYVDDWDSAGRSERVDVVDPVTGAVLDSRTISSFQGGEYLTWEMSGHVQLVFTSLTGPNAVLSGLFFGGAPAADPEFVGTDVTTQGSWKGIYGTDGYNVIGDASSYPSYATVNPSGQSSWTWAASTSDVRALQDASVGSADRLASCWYGSGFSVDINLTDGQLHEVSIYVDDWDSAGRSERVDVVDPVTGAVLDSRTISSFQGGEYLTWEMSGHVQLVFTSLTGPNAVLSGLFFGGAPAADPEFVGTDVTTQGSWKGIYGTDGYNVIGDASSYPSYATVNPSGQSSWTWAASTSDVRALQDASVGSADRLASCWYGSGFSVDINLTDGQLHEVSIYVDDWDSAGRSERVDVVDPVTGAVLDSRTISSFQGGEYLTWEMSGHVQLVFTSLTGPNAVLSGLFFG